MCSDVNSLKRKPTFETILQKPAKMLSSIYQQNLTCPEAIAPSVQVDERISKVDSILRLRKWSYKNKTMAALVKVNVTFRLDVCLVVIY